MILFGRVILLISFALFWGGLTFYTGIVVRIEHDVLDEPIMAGLITQRTTNVMQALAVITVVQMGVNGFVVAGRCRRLGYILISISTLIALAIIGLYIVHGHLDAVIDVAAREVTDYESFATGHRRYNQLTTVEWLSSISYLVITVIAWQRFDKEV